MSPETAAVVFGLLSAITWGSGDFGGGLASRRLAAAQVAFWVNVVGTALFFSLAVAWGEALLVRDVPWAVAAGASGALGLICLYQALSLGRMGLVAPVAAVVGVAVPVLVGGVLEGLPQPLQLLGFAFGLAGVWLASQSGEGGRPAGLGYALLAGVGFGGFFVLIDQVQGLFFPLAVGKLASALLIGLLVLRLRVVWPQGGVWPLLGLAGLMDAGGNLFFLAATQAGRLDVAAVVSSLYPAATVLWARVILRERLNRLQVVGVGFAFAAIVLIAAFG